MQTAKAFDPGIVPSDYPIPEPNSPFSIPLSISLPTLLLAGGVSFAVLISFFPVFSIADELLAQMPPDGVAKARENAFARNRFTNALLAVSVVSLAVTILLPAGLIFAKRVRHSALSYLIPVAVASSFIACVGVLLAHAIMELTSSATLGMTRTMLAHWIEFGLFGVAVGTSIGFAIGDRAIAIDACKKGLLAGLIAATVFDLISVAMPRIRIDVLIPGGVLRGTQDPILIVIWVMFLLLPLAIAFRSIGQKPKQAN